MKVIGQAIASRYPCHRSLVLLLACLLCACTASPWNNPYSAADAVQNTLYAAFDERPKHLDPVLSYSENEAIFVAQIYEPPLQYHFLRRPYELIPLIATEVPKPTHLDARGQILPDNSPVEEVAYSVYRIAIKPGIYYQPHPAFAKSATGDLLYHALTPADLASIQTLADFKRTDTRELTAADYAYQIKRMAHPKLHSPIAGLMSEYIVGLSEFAQRLAQAYAELEAQGHRPPFLDLSQFEIEGVKVIDRYTYEIKLKGKYPQFRYWLAMPFFAALPWEAERFYTQAGMQEKNITLDWYPVGTGPYMLIENNPNRRMVLQRNPHFHGETYPLEGEASDQPMLEDVGKPLPFIDQAIYSLELENIPYWSKFLQGYYDTSGISSDSFDQAIQFGTQGEPELTEAMAEKGLQLLTAVEPSLFYMGFNMLDEVVGGLTERARRLRQAIAIAVDYEEFISIFTNGRGIAAQGPLPPGIFGYKEGAEGINPSVYEWVNGQPRRRSIEAARSVLIEAGYPDGRDTTTGKPLVLHYDTALTGPEAKARLDWLRKQFIKLGLQLDIRATDYNRFQDKMLKGTAQIFEWGWNADYPDPENFLFLLYGPNAKALHQGENAANYQSPDFDRLFERMKSMENTPERQALIDQMVAHVRRDVPWAGGWHPVQYSLYHAWYKNTKPNQMARNTLKYRRLDPPLRARLRAEWNHPVLWPVIVLASLMVVGIVPAVLSYRRRERATAL
ncbi:MAG TPA: ABC transporter substrate-binding protein [Gammaproteobacteria bacterium]|nr:ABC transporter substrate-binding protein [Gammaproteobacteria bacterium]